MLANAPERVQQGEIIEGGGKVEVGDDEAVGAGVDEQEMERGVVKVSVSGKISRELLAREVNQTDFDGGQMRDTFGEHG